MLDCAKRCVFVPHQTRTVIRYRSESEPHPHLVIEEIVPAAVYERLRFPDDLIEPQAGWGLTAADPLYETLLLDPGWRALHDELRGEPFVRGVLACFADQLRDQRCLVDPERARVVRFTESREQKEQGALSPDADPNEVYTRLDFQSKTQGAYRDFVHLDWPRRIVGGILFFSDADEERLEGGELAFYRDRAFRNDRWCHDPELTRLFVPRHNTGVIFLNSNSGFHGPRAISRLEGRRRWLYYTISSRRDVWPRDPRSQ